MPRTTGGRLMARLPSIDAVRDLLTLDAEFGVLRWRRDIYTETGRLTCFRAGGQAGGRTPVVKVAGSHHSSLAVAWMLAFGDEPKGPVVPLDGDKRNLRPGNLLDCGAQFAPRTAPRLGIEDALTADEARAIFNYDDATGVLTWKCNRRTTKGYINARAGSQAGGKDKKGYLAMSFQPPRSPKPIYYFAHRIIWLIVTGAWPTSEVDHVNGDKSDNRWQNLRHADDEINSQNRRHANRNNSTGFLGVTIDKSGLYVSRIGHRRKLLVIGKYPTPQEAHKAYVEAKRRLHAGGTL